MWLENGTRSRYADRLPKEKTCSMFEAGVRDGRRGEQSDNVLQ